MTYSALIAQVRPVIDRWFAAWSHGAEPWNGDAFRALFKPGAGAIEVVDDMGGTTLTLDSVEAYIETWAPFMSQFSYWTIAPWRPSRCALPTTSPLPASPSWRRGATQRASRFPRHRVSTPPWSSNNTTAAG